MNLSFPLLPIFEIFYREIIMQKLFSNFVHNEFDYEKGEC
jgi:hypothetical protein